VRAFEASLGRGSSILAGGTLAAIDTWAGARAASGNDPGALRGNEEVEIPAVTIRLGKALLVFATSEVGDAARMAAAPGAGASGSAVCSSAGSSLAAR
jgi:hypothetical protein